MPHPRTQTRRDMRSDADVLSVLTVAGKLSVSEQTVLEKIRSGELTAYQEGKRYFIPRRLFEHYLRDREQQAEAETARRRQGPMRELITGYSRAKHAR